jgi:hypothetical protein
MTTTTWVRSHLTLRVLHPVAVVIDTPLERCSGYIIELNTDAYLHQSLYNMTTNDAVMASFTEEQRRTAVLLQQDFER